MMMILPAGFLFLFFLVPVLSQQLALPGIHCPEIGLFGFPHETACDQYYRCENGTLTHEVCPNGLLFDTNGGAVYDLCNYYWRVDCGNRIDKPGPISSPNCPWQFGIFPSGSCIQYFKCEWGYANLTDCEPGLAYDDSTHSCNWPDLVPDCDSEAIVGFRCPEVATGLAAKFYPYPRYPHPNDCTKLINCVGGKPRLISCGYGNAFALHSHTCEPAENVPDCIHGKRR